MRFVRSFSIKYWIIFFIIISFSISIIYLIMIYNINKPIENIVITNDINNISSGSSFLSYWLNFIFKRSFFNNKKSKDINPLWNRNNIKDPFYNPFSAFYIKIETKESTPDINNEPKTQGPKYEYQNEEEFRRRFMENIPDNMIRVLLARQKLIEILGTAKRQYIELQEKYSFRGFFKKNK